MNLSDTEGPAVEASGGVVVLDTCCFGGPRILLSPETAEQWAAELMTAARDAQKDG